MIDGRSRTLTPNRRIIHVLPIKSADKGDGEIQVTPSLLSEIDCAVEMSLDENFREILIPRIDIWANLLFSGRFHSLVCPRRHLPNEDDLEEATFVLTLSRDGE